MYQAEYARAAQGLRAHLGDIRSLLSLVATHDAIESEISATLKLLEHHKSESAWHSSIARETRVSSFLPSNNILYSFFLYGVLPAPWAAGVRGRPSARVAETYFGIYDVISTYLPDTLRLVTESQREFVEGMDGTDVVVFTGDSENGRRVASTLRDVTLFLGFGSGPNPVVVGPSADLLSAVADTVKSRLYNAGQDCLAPDVIFVHESVSAAFESELIQSLQAVPIGERQTPGLVLAPLVYADAAEAAKQWTAAHTSDTRWTSDSSDAEHFVRATVITQDATRMSKIGEHFAPIFHLVRYNNVAEILRWAHEPQNYDHGFYASIYGEELLDTPLLGSAVNVGGRSALDAEDGNSPFGGYGKKASWVRWRGSERGQPLLLSREVATYLGSNS